MHTGKSPHSYKHIHNQISRLYTTDICRLHWRRLPTKLWPTHQHIHTECVQHCIHSFAVCIQIHAVFLSPSVFLTSIHTSRSPSFLRLICLAREKSLQIEMRIHYILPVTLHTHSDVSGNSRKTSSSVSINITYWSNCVQFDSHCNHLASRDLDYAAQVV